MLLPLTHTLSVLSKGLLALKPRQQGPIASSPLELSSLSSGSLERVPLAN